MKAFPRLQSRPSTKRSEFCRVYEAGSKIGSGVLKNANPRFTALNARSRHTVSLILDEAVHAFYFVKITPLMALLETVEKSGDE